MSGDEMEAIVRKDVTEEIRKIVAAETRKIVAAETRKAMTDAALKAVTTEQMLDEIFEHAERRRREEGAQRRAQYRRKLIAVAALVGVLAIAATVLLAVFSLNAGSGKAAWAALVMAVISAVNFLNMAFFIWLELRRGK